MQLVVCETEEQLRRAQELRYEVFCLEKGWIDAASCDGGVETDEFDADAVHFLVYHDNGELLGTSRLLRGECQELPAARYIDLATLGLDSSAVVEVSRMATKRTTRSQNLLVFLALTQAMWEWSMDHGMQAWLSVSDIPVHALMRRVGMPILAEGPHVDYLGSMCVPACVEMARTGDVLSKRGFAAQNVNP